MFPKSTQQLKLREEKSFLDFWNFWKPCWTDGLANGGPASEICSAASLDYGLLRALEGRGDEKMDSVRFYVSTAGFAVALCMLSPSRASADEFIVNGSFEADSFTGSGLGFKLGLVGSGVTGWFIPASDGVYPWGLQNINAFSGGPAADGNQWLVLGETGASGGTPNDYTIQQTMTGLSPGSTYHLSFDISSEEAGSGSVVQVSFLSGSSTLAADFTAPGAITTFWNPWALEQENFIATSSSVTLQFKQLAIEFPTSADLGLDNVHVSSAVPEPTSVILLGTVVLGVAWTLKRKRVQFAWRTYPRTSSVHVVAPRTSQALRRTGQDFAQRFS